MGRIQTLLLLTHSYEDSFALPQKNADFELEAVQCAFPAATDLNVYLKGYLYMKEEINIIKNFLNSFKRAWLLEL